MKNKKLLAPLFIVVATLSCFVYQKVKAANIPDLKEGTYLSGQTLSTWPSWSLLGNALGVSLPSDPINQLATAGTCASDTRKFCIKDSTCESPVTTTSQKCVLHDPETGWSVADRRFTFACSKDSYAYRYIVSTSTGSYTVRAHLEDTGFAPANNSRFISSFVSTTIFKINDSSGVCNFDEEISSMQSGYCGDGKLNPNKGEQCDPPGRIEYANGCSGNVKNLTVCNSNCRWTPSTTLCSSLSKCGNGTIEFGESCDDGKSNGKYNKCNLTCTGKSAEYCGDTHLQSIYEVCDTGAPGLEKYAQEKNDSCSWDCQNWGPYCGDGLVQNKYGEECDGSQACSVDGNPGVKVCSNDCLKVDKDAAAWWRFERLAIPTRTSDSSGNDNDANCALATCPDLGMGKYGHGFAFTQNSAEPKFFTVAHSQSLTPTTSLTVEAWIFPISTSSFYQRIVEKGGPSTGKGYDLEFNIASGVPNATPTVRFNLWNVTQTSVDSQSAIAMNAWTHIVGTYQKSGSSNVAKIYINGVLEGENSVDSTSPIMASPDLGSLTIGKSVAAPNNYFFGSLDEVKIYNQTLSASAVKNNYQSGWFCYASSTAVNLTAPGTSGNNVVDANEVCDRGTSNNGKACVPNYGASCSYCSADCQNTIDVQPSQYCGNGIIESVERCEVSAGVIYSGVSSTGRTSSEKDRDHNGFEELACSAEEYVPHVLKKGTKTCDNCVAGVVRNCVSCGLDPLGVSIEGSVINVLATSTGIKDPLFTKNQSSSSLRLSIGSCLSSVAAGPDGIQRNMCDNPLATSPLIGQSKKTANASPEELISYTLLNPYAAGNALVNSNPVCSQDSDPTKKYLIYVNRDYTRPITFPVVAQPSSWQYDLVLSPVVSSTLRAKDLRVVVSWIGSGDFYGGVLNPFNTTTPQSSQLEGPSFVTQRCIPNSPCKFISQYAVDTDYYKWLGFRKAGVWYHGFNSTPGQTSAEAFTIDTSVMSGNTYSFYVRAPSYPIRTFKNTAKLKVDVYLPENDNDKYHFGTPAKTYYFSSAAPSDNQNARYWQVFNINGTSPRVSLADILDVNTIFTGPAFFRYTNPLIASPQSTPPDDQNSQPAPPNIPVPPVGGPQKPVAPQNFPIKQ